MITRTATRRRRLASIALAGAAAVGILTGCSAHPGAAAVVDGTRISTADVAAVEMDLGHVGLNPVPGNILEVMIQAEVVHRVARDAGLAASDDDARQALATVASSQQVDTSNYAFAPATLSVYRSFAEIEKIKAAPDATELTKKVSADLTKTKPTVNPRFEGSTNEKNQWVPTTPTWIVQPKAQAPSAQAGTETAE